MSLRYLLTVAGYGLVLALQSLALAPGLLGFFEVESQNHRIILVRKTL